MENKDERIGKQNIMFILLIFLFVVRKAYIYIYIYIYIYTLPRKDKTRNIFFLPCLSMDKGKNSFIAINAKYIFFPYNTKTLITTIGFIMQ